MEVAEIVASLLGALTILGGLTAWVLKSTIAPVRMSIDNNSKVIERVIKKLDEHDEKLVDHGERIVKIETTHEVKRCVEASA